MFGQPRRRLWSPARREPCGTARTKSTPPRIRRRTTSRSAEQQAYAAQQQAAAPAAPAEPDYAAELEQLAKLKQQGILTDEEFEAKKKQILGI